MNALKISLRKIFKFKIQGNIPKSDTFPFIKKGSTHEGDSNYPVVSYNVILKLRFDLLNLKNFIRIIHF